MGTGEVLGLRTEQAVVVVLGSVLAQGVVLGFVRRPTRYGVRFPDRRLHVGRSEGVRGQDAGGHTVVGVVVLRLARQTSLNGWVEGPEIPSRTSASLRPCPPDTEQLMRTHV